MDPGALDKANPDSPAAPPVRAGGDGRKPAGRGWPRWATRLAFGALALFFLSVSVNKIWVVDFWWQLRTGEIILESRAWPTHDLLSYTAADRPWIEMRWLYCVLLYLGWKAGGAELLVLAQTGVLATCWGLILWSARRAAATPAGLLVLALAVAAGAGRYVVRPELATYLFFTIDLVLLDLYRQRRSRLVWLLPLVQVVWTNSHTMFVFGPIAAICFLGGETAARALERRRGGAQTLAEPRAGGAAAGARRGLVDGPLAIVTFLTAAACWVNPYFHEGVKFPFILFGQIQPGHVLQRSIEEFRGPFDLGMASWAFNVWAALGLGGAGLASFALHRRRPDLGRLALWAGLSYVAALSVRNAGIFSFGAAWVALANLRDAGIGARPVRGAGAAMSAALAAGLLWSAWFFGTDRYSARVESPREFGAGVSMRLAPVGATAFMLKEKLEPEVFNLIADGCYLAWAAKDRFRVHVDGRLEVYGWDFLTDHFTNALSDWERTADRWGANVILLRTPGNEAALARMSRAPGWALVYLDHVSAVFAREIPAHAGVIARCRIDPRVVWTPRGEEPDERPSGWRRMLGFAPRAWHSLPMARNWLALGSADNAEPYLRRALDVEPANAEARLKLRAIALFKGRAEEAARIGAGVIEDAPAALRGDAEALLAGLLLSAGRRDEAVEALERAIALNPGDAAARDALARQLFALGRYPRARSLLEESIARERDLSQIPARLGALGSVLERMGERDRAIETYRRALALDPNEPLSNRGLRRLGAAGSTPP